MALAHDACSSYANVKGTSTGIQGIGNVVNLFMGADQDTDPRYPVDVCFSISNNTKSRHL